jgi:hypothetical protein
MGAFDGVCQLRARWPSDHDPVRVPAAMTNDREVHTPGEGTVSARLVRCLQAHLHLADGAPGVRPSRAQAARGIQGYEPAGMPMVALTRPGEPTRIKRPSRAGAGRRRRPPTGALLARTQEQLAFFRDRELGRELGTCSRCGRAVRSQQDSIRESGSVIHVRCHIPGPRQGPRATVVPGHAPSERAAPVGAGVAIHGRGDVRFTWWSER